MAEPSYIAVEGVIGVGKTSLARILSERLEARLLLERHDENPFLAEFYRDRARYGFQTQMFFLFSRYEQLNEAYNYFFFHYDQAPLLVVNTREIDFVENQADQAELLSRILEHREGVAYYAPLGHGSGA